LRKFRNNDINSVELDSILKGIDEQLRFFQEIYMAGDIVAEASMLVQTFGKVYGLCTLDAIHLACWQLHADKTCRFVTSDRVHAEVVKEMEGKVVLV